LRRIGAKKQPAYRIVAADSRAPRDGRFIEILGSYNPLTHPSTVVINAERAMYWLRQGAQPTDVVKKMFVKAGVWAVFTGEAAPESLLAPVVEVAVEEVVTEAPAEEAPAEEVAPEAPAAEAAVEETAPEAPAAEETPAE
jgi:small subunit ribosomal protein S16